MRRRIVSFYMVIAIGVFSVVTSTNDVQVISAAHAATNPDEVMDDPALEARARDLAKELRCLVCQNQSIDDSNAGLARDLRRIVRERLLAGDTDVEIIEYVTARYGDFVLLRPPMKPSTWGLWYGPPAIFVIAGAFLAAHLRRRRHQNGNGHFTPLSEEEEIQLERLMKDDEHDHTS